MQIYLQFPESCTNFNDYIVLDTLRLGIKNKRIYFVLLSACSIFAPTIEKYNKVTI